MNPPGVDVYFVEAFFLLKPLQRHFYRWYGHGHNLSPVKCARTLYLSFAKVVGMLEKAMFDGVKQWQRVSFSAILRWSSAPFLCCFCVDFGMRRPVCVPLSLCRVWYEPRAREGWIGV